MWAEGQLMACWACFEWTEQIPDAFQKGSGGLAVKVGFEIILFASLFIVYFPGFLLCICICTQIFKTLILLM